MAMSNLGARALTGVLVALALAACNQSLPPTPGATATTAAVSPPLPTARPTPALAPVPTITSVAFEVQATVAEHCGSEGGCAYYIDLGGGDGTSWHARFEWDADGLRLADGVASTLPPGDYRLMLTSYLVSDVTVNNEPFPESLDTTCSVAFKVAPDHEAELVASVTFGADECSVGIES